MSDGDYLKGIDLVVVNYRSPVDLGHFLASFEKHKPDVPHSLSIGNVDPLADDREIVERSGRPFAEWDANVGYATAVNFLAAQGGAEVIGIFNADTRLTENVVQECYNALVSNPTWAVVGPRQVDDTNRITHGGIFGTNAQRQDRGFHHRNCESYNDVRDDAITVAGSAYFIKRSVWDELLDCPIYASAFPNALGAFLPTQHYFEETWCSFHAREHGYKVTYLGTSTMIHKWHGASPRGGFADRQVRGSRDVFRWACEKHGIEHE